MIESRVANLLTLKISGIKKTTPGEGWLGFNLEIL